MDTNDKSACFTGHRPHKLSFGYQEESKECIALKHTLSNLIETLILEHSVTRLISGLALGFDVWAAEAVLALQKQYPKLILQAAVPSIDQTEKWNGANKAYKVRYNSILETIGQENIIYTSSESMTGKSKDVMAAMYSTRNQYMVDHSDFVIACWTGDASGTSKTIKYAVTGGRSYVYCLNPFHPTGYLEITPGDISRLKLVADTLKKHLSE